MGTRNRQRIAMVLEQTSGVTREQMAALFGGGPGQGRPGQPGGPGNFGPGGQGNFGPGGRGQPGAPGNFVRAPRPRAASSRVRRDSSLRVAGPAGDAPPVASEVPGFARRSVFGRYEVVTSERFPGR